MFPQAGALRAGAGSGPCAQCVIVVNLIDGGEDAAERGGVRAARPPGPVLRRAQPQQQILRCRRGPFPGRVQLTVPSHARNQRQCQHVVQRVHAAPPAAGIADGTEEPPQPRELAVVPACRPRNPHQLPSARRRPGGHRARQRRGQRRAPLCRQPRRQPGRQRQLRRRRGQELRDRRHLRQHRRKHLRDQGTARHGHGRLRHAGFLRDHG